MVSISRLSWIKRFMVILRLPTSSTDLGDDVERRQMLPMNRNAGTCPSDGKALHGQRDTSIQPCRSVHLIQRLTGLYIVVQDMAMQRRWQIAGHSIDWSQLSVPLA